MQCNSTRCTTGTLLKFLGFIQNYAACRPAACKKFQQSQLGKSLNFYYNGRMLYLNKLKFEKKWSIDSGSVSAKTSCWASVGTSFRFASLLRLEHYQYVKVT